MNKYTFSSVFASAVEFRAKTWEQLQSAFPNASYFQNKFITSDNVYFVLASQFNYRQPLWTQNEFLGYFNLQVLKGLEDLSYSMGLWLDTTIETSISDPTKRGEYISAVISGTNTRTASSVAVRNDTTHNSKNVNNTSQSDSTTNVNATNETFIKANDFSDVATPIDTTSTIANQNKTSSTNVNVGNVKDTSSNVEVDDGTIESTNNINDQSSGSDQNNSNNTRTNFIENIQRLYSAELSSRWNVFLKQFNWLFKSVFASQSTTSGDNGDFDFQAEIDAINEKINEIVAFANALNTQVQQNKADINGIKQEILTDIVPELTEQGTAIAFLGDKPVLNNSQGEIIKFGEVTEDNPVLTKNAVGKITTTGTPWALFNAAQYLVQVNESDTKAQQVLKIPIDMTGKKPNISVAYEVQVQMNDNSAATGVITHTSSRLRTTFNAYIDATLPAISEKVLVEYSGDGAVTGRHFWYIDKTDAQQWYFCTYLAVSNFSNDHFDWFEFSGAVEGANTIGLKKEHIIVPALPDDIYDYTKYSAPTLIDINPAWTEFKELPSINGNYNSINTLNNDLIDLGGKNVKIDATTTYKKLQEVDTTTNPIITLDAVYPIVSPMITTDSTIKIVRDDVNKKIGLGAILSQANIYPGVKPILVAGANTTITPNDTAGTLTITASGGSAGEDDLLRAKGVIQSTGQTTLLASTEPLVSKLEVDSLVAAAKFTPTQANLYPEIKPMLVAGENITLTPNDTNSTLTIVGPTPTPPFTPSQANIYPTVKPMLTAGANIVLTPTDASNTIQISAEQFVPSQGNIYPIVKPIMVAGSNMTITPNDTGTTLTFASTGGTSFSPTQANIYPTIKPMLVGSNGLVVTPIDSNNTIKLDTSSLANAVQGNTNQILTINAIKVQSQSQTYTLGTTPTTELVATKTYVDSKASGFTPTQANIYPTVKPMLLAGNGISINPDDTSTSITISGSGGGSWNSKDPSNYDFGGDIGKPSKIKYNGYVYSGSITTNGFVGYGIDTGDTSAKSITTKRLYIYLNDPSNWKSNFNAYIEQSETYVDPAKPQRNLTNSFTQGDSAPITSIDVWG